MLFQCDQLLAMNLFKGEYSSALSSDDIFDPELPLVKNRAKGGTMALWKKHLDQYVSSPTSTSSSFLPIVFSFPDSPVTILITLYLPTAGKHVEFVEEIANLDCCINDLTAKYQDAVIFIRGDANVNGRDENRKAMLKKLCNDWNLMKMDLGHNTYHHFLGNGVSDSQLDVLLRSENSSETLHTIFCKHEDPQISSHHDALLSSFYLPKLLLPPPDPEENPLAPRISNDRVKIQWTENGTEDYKKLVAENLARMRSNWLDSSSSSSFAVLIQSTNSFLNKCAKESNSFVQLNSPPQEKSTKKPTFLKVSEANLCRSYRSLRKAASASSPQYAFISMTHKEAKRAHKRLQRQFDMREASKRDRVLDSIRSEHPSQAFRRLRRLKNSRSEKVSKMKVGQLTYFGNTVPDGIYESIRKLKTDPTDIDKDEPNLPNFTEEYRLILDICKTGRKIPLLSKEQSFKILSKIRKNVNDFYSITALHYLNAGTVGQDHFHFLLNGIISNINHAGIDELNTIYACVLYKGHEKDKTSDRSYRTISTCPLVAKGLDMHVRELSIDGWNEEQCETQYQGTGSSHELAALLLTETIQHSLNVSNLPIFALFLDAKSAFDRVLKEILVRNLFTAGTDDHRLLYIDQRLKKRRTFCEYDKEMMGPIMDTKGLEQGGIASSDMYKAYNNEQGTSAQNSNLGVTIRGITISSITLADDTVLTSNSIINLQLLLHLTTEYCKKYRVELVPDKTKLLVFSKNADSAEVMYAKLISPISLNGQEIVFSEQAEHLGILRSVSAGNMPNIMERVSAHNKKLFSLLPAGLSLHHHANPAACLRVEQLYALPVLLSGLAALVLTKQESDIISACYKNTLQRLMKLHDRTPDCVVFLLAGSLPATALLHLRQLSLLIMISHLEGNTLKSVLTKILIEAKPAANSWIQQVRNICLQYQLPHPLQLFSSPMKKDKFKTLCKQKVSEYWHRKLCHEADLPSLSYLQPGFLSFSSPHPIFTSLDGNPYQAKAARIQSLFLSGRYRTEQLCRFWTQNKNGVCLLDSCKEQHLPENIQHILLHCDGLTEVRRRLIDFTKKFTDDKPVLRQIIETYLFSQDQELRMQFLMDCSVLPLVISTFQEYGPNIHQSLYRISRTWCRSVHVARLKALGRYCKA